MKNFSSNIFTVSDTTYVEADLWHFAEIIEIKKSEMNIQGGSKK